MQVLDQAVEVMRKQGADGARVAAALEAIAASGEEAARVWQGYLNSPGAPGDKYTVMSWVGSERARQLYDLSLKAKEQVNVVSPAAGSEARFLVLGESPIVLAYGGLKEGESGPQATQAALATQQAMNKPLFKDLSFARRFENWSNIIRSARKLRICQRYQVPSS